MAQVIRVFDAVTTDGPSQPYEIDGFAAIRAQVWSAAGSDAVVKIEVRTDDNDAPWYLEATITNPSATGELWVLPPAGQVRLNITTYNSGTIYANLERFTVRGTA